MSLPASGPLSYSDIRTETQTTGRSPYSAARAAWTTGSYSLIQYPPINMGSTSRPNISQPATVTEWYSYNHSAFSSAPATVTNLGNRTKPTSPYGDFYIIDLGTTSGVVDYTIAINQSSGFGASVDIEYGYPWDSSGNYVGGPGGTLLSTGLITSTTTGNFTYTYNAGIGSKVYISIASIQSSNGWPTFDVTLQAPVSDFDITFYSKAGDTIYPNEYNLYYSIDNSNWSYLAGPLYSTTCTQLSTVALPPTFYIKAERDFDNEQVYIHVNPDSSTCPPNTQDSCTATVSGYNQDMDVAITVYSNGSDVVNC